MEKKERSMDAKESRKEESQMEVRAKRGDESGFENERILNSVY